MPWSDNDTLKSVSLLEVIAFSSRRMSTHVQNHHKLTANSKSASLTAVPLRRRGRPITVLLSLLNDAAVNEAEDCGAAS